MRPQQEKVERHFTFRGQQFVISPDELLSATEEARTLYNQLATAMYARMRQRPILVSPSQKRCPKKHTFARFSNTFVQAAIVFFGAVWLFLDMLSNCGDMMIAGVLSRRLAFVILFCTVMGAAIRLFRALAARIPANETTVRAHQ